MSAPLVACLDLEGVLVPEIWIGVAETTGIAELRRTTRDEPDYDKLMRGRLAILEREKLGIADIQKVIAGMRPLDGAPAFLDWLRARAQVIILSDTFMQFAQPLMAQLGFPTLFCHSLVIDDAGRIRDYRLRIADGKRKAVMALKLLNFRVAAAGDSYNDTSMLDEARPRHPFLSARQRHPRLPAVPRHAHLRRAPRGVRNGRSRDGLTPHSEASMHFDYSDKVKALQKRVGDFMDEHVFPNEETFVRQINEGSDRWQPAPIVEELKEKAKAAGLWNLFLPDSERGFGLTNLEYAPLAELMGRVHFASEVFNCSAPDTGNMEVLERYGNDEHKKQWLAPLLDGKIRSAFAMTEPAVASSDATNIESKIVRDGDDYVINGRKWWTSGAGDPRCKIMIFMGKTAPDNPDRYRQQSMISCRWTRPA